MASHVLLVTQSMVREHFFNADGEMLIVAQGLAVFRLEFLPEMAATRFFPVQRVEADELSQLQEVCDPARLLQRLVQLGIAPRHVDVPPELRPELRDQAESFLESRGVPGHTAIIPHDLAQLAVE